MAPKEGKIDREKRRKECVLVKVCVGGAVGV